jgi:uncharacterized protein YcbX
VITVARISIAPVKALALVFPPEVELTRTGVVGDRCFWLCDAAGRLVNNKRHGALALIRPAWDEQGGELALAFPGGPVVSGLVELGKEVEATLYGAPFPSRPVLGPWDAALSEFAGEPVRLLWAPAGATDRGRMGGSVTLVSRASLRHLGAVCGHAGPLDGRRFRMLLELEGVGPHCEDGWIGRRLQVGAAEIRVRGDVGRCVVTSQNPDTGVTDVDTLGALADYRRTGHDEPLPFGVYGEVLAPGRVRVGDFVTVEAAAGRAAKVADGERRSRAHPATTASSAEPQPE